MLHLRSDNWTPQQFDDLQQIVEAIAQMRRDLTPYHKDWTAIIRGSGIAGTYQIASQLCRYTRIGRYVWLDVYITMAGTVTGGGTGYLQITGLPFAKAANTFPVGSVFTNGLDFTTAGASLSLQFIATTASNVLFIHENVDNSAGNDLPISAIGANDGIAASICYETDDPL